MNNIVPILILCQHAHRLQNLMHYYALRFRAVAMFQDSLYDPTPIWVGGQCHDLVIKCSNNKLNGILWNAFDTFLNYMISILITNTTHNLAIKLHNHFCLLIQINNLKYLLNNSATIHLQAKSENMASKFVSQFSNLGGTSMFKKLKDHIITKHISH
nr:hypothetical protein Iba_scaffold23292CG0020 [Ipomoea batatas]